VVPPASRTPRGSLISRTRSRSSGEAKSSSSPAPSGVTRSASSTFRACTGAATSGSWTSAGSWTSGATTLVWFASAPAPKVQGQASSTWALGQWDSLSPFDPSRQDRTRHPSGLTGRVFAFYLDLI